MSRTPISRRDLLDFLDQVELDYPVTTWEIENVKVWPLIKIDLFFRHVEREGKDDLLSNLRPKRKASSRFTLLVKVISSFFYFLLLILKKGRHIDVFFSDSSGHRVLHNESFINRYFKPVADYLRTEDHTISFLTINDDTGNFDRYPKDESIYFINRYLLGVKLWRKVFKSRRLTTELVGFNEFQDKLGDKRLSYLNADHKYINHIKRRVQDVLATSTFVDILIKKHKPKIVFELCYYSTLRFGVNHSAFRRGVKTVEIQHGGMGKNHVSYSGWRELPKKGYSLLPQVFWLWDESSKRLVEEWTEGNEYHSAILGGNPGLSYVQKSHDVYSFPEDRRIILYTLQYTTIPAHAINAIKSTPGQFQWWIRLHPRKLDSKPIIEKLLMENGINIGEVEIEKATTYPLPSILPNTHIHVSGSSGSVIEAAQMGVFSLLIEEGGNVYYADLIKAGKAKISYTSEDILENILAHENGNRFSNQEENDFLYKDLVRGWLK